MNSNWLCSLFGREEEEEEDDDIYDADDADDDADDDAEKDADAVVA